MEIEIPGYTLMRALGKGGMATVFLAKQDVLERQVALKVMSRHLAEDPAFGERFMREARIVSQLAHRNIVTIHDVGQHEGYYYLSMEYIDGHDLRTVRKTLDIYGKIRVIEDMARALHYAGEKGYVHRDIKPENIMFRTLDGSAVLTDFGIAKAVNSDLTMTQTGTAIGTPHYMSPEQAKGQQVDQRSDLYSLGVVFHLLLTGRVPYDADTAVAIGIKHITEPVPTLPPELNTFQPIIDGLLAKDPAHRYQNGLALLNDLRRVDMVDVEAADVAMNSQPTVISTAPGQASQVDPSEAETDRFTLEFEAVDEEHKAPGSIWPMFFASAFIAVAVLTLIYIARPPALEPIFQRMEEQLSGWQEGAASQWDTVKPAPEAEEPEAETEPALVEVTPEPVPVETEPETTVVEEQEEEVEALTAREPSTEENAELEVEAEAEPEPVVPAPPSLSALEQELAALRADGARSEAGRDSYIAVHYKLLEHFPEHSPTLASLSDMKKRDEAAIIRLAEQGAASEVNQALETYRKRYPDSESGSYKVVKSDAQRQLNLYRLAQQARRQVAAEQFATPPGDNALETYEKMMSLAVEHPTAMEGLASLSHRFELDAQTALENEDYQTAQTQARLAVRANSNNQRARDIKAQADEALAHQRRVEQAMSTAKKYERLGYLFSPLGGSAYDQYNYVLSIDPGNDEAQAGLSGLVDRLSVKVWGLVGDARFDEARAALDRPLSIMPDNERLQSMRAAVEEVAQR